MHTFFVEWEQGKTKYQALYECIAEHIRNGSWQENEKLPSKRQLAEFLHISIHTIETAYDMLLEEGYIYAKSKVGYYVASVALLTKTVNFASHSAARKEKVSYPYDFKTNAIDTDIFPFATWGRLTRGTMNYHADLLMSGDGQGDLSLRESICQYLEEFRGVHCDASQIVIGAGMEYLLLVLVNLFSDDSVYALENPGYFKTYNFLKNMKKPLKKIEVDENGMRLDKLKATCANIAYVTPSHQFPTGAVMPVGRRMELLNWAQEKENRYIIEDDYDSEFRFGAKPIPSIQGLSSADKVVYVSTFSRTLAPSIRVAYMVLPHTLMQVYAEKFRYEASTVSRFEQHTLDKFIREGYFVRYLNRARKAYRKKKDALVDAILLNFSKEEYQIYGADYGLHLLLSLTADIDELTVVTAAKKRGVKIHALSQYWLGEPKAFPKRNATFVLGYAGMTSEEIHKGIKTLAGIIHTLLSGK